MLQASARSTFATRCLTACCAALLVASEAGCGDAAASAKPRRPDEVAGVKTAAFAATDGPAKHATTSLQAHCRDIIGPPRIVDVTPKVHVAIGYDLANTILIETAAGHVVVDPGMSPTRAAVTKAALLKRFPGSIAAIIYTHSHIDHVGGAAAWVEPQTEIIATAQFADHFFDQYDALLRAEKTRGQRQFGRDVATEDVPCSGIGKRPDIDAALDVGVVLPTKTFHDTLVLEIGGQTLDLREAGGETDDQLLVWLPTSKTLLCGDNYYAAFPNLYTIRGTRPRSTTTWIESLDAMRRLRPEVLVPSHTAPVIGAAEVLSTLRDYRDAIQWVRDQVFRGANAGLALDDVVASAALPPHLSKVPALQQLYGQSDWSARAVYTNTLGWFDGKAKNLYPLDDTTRANEYVTLLGGPARVLDAANAAADPRFALELLTFVERVRIKDPAPDDVDNAQLNQAFAHAYERLAAQTRNPNGRAYLLQSAAERRGEIAPSPALTPSAVFVANMPVKTIFETMVTRLKVAEATKTHESVHFILDDLHVYLTVRFGVAELTFDAPLPGMPRPVATVRASQATWRQLALHQLSSARALATGALHIDGGTLAFAKFMDRFDRDLVAPPDVLP